MLKILAPTPKKIQRKNPTWFPEPGCGSALYMPKFYFILFFKIKFGNKNENFEELLAQY